MAGAIVPQRTFHRAPPIPVWLGLQSGRARTDRPNAKPIIAEPGNLRSIRAPARFGRSERMGLSSIAANRTPFMPIQADWDGSAFESLSAGPPDANAPCLIRSSFFKSRQLSES